MKTDTLKVSAVVPGILLVLISLYLNFAWHAELREYRAAEAYLAERDPAAAEYWQRKWEEAVKNGEQTR